jgi:hypothetical protein
MKSKLAITFFILGILTYLIGVLFRIQHWKNGNEVMMTGRVLLFGGLGLYLYLQFKKSKTNN